MWPLCMPSALLQKQDTAPYMSWSSSAKDEPNSLISPVQNGWISRYYIVKGKIVIIVGFSQFSLHTLPPHISVSVRESWKNSAICLLYRKLTDLNDSDVETDLQGLVSNILDEVGSQNGYNGRYGKITCLHFG